MRAEDVCIDGYFSKAILMAGNLVNSGDFSEVYPRTRRLGGFALPEDSDATLASGENAIRYNRRAGTVKILTDVGGGGKPFVLIIENTGIGITSEESSKIGTALFYRGEHARTAHATGMGIGLSVVKAIVKAHHGHFSIVSAGRDSGAKVRIELPR